MVKAHVELLGSHTGDSNRSVLLFFDEERYLFECGDGTQRLCTEYGVSIATEKLHRVFVSRMDPASIGGLLGMALTVADSGRKALNIVGPEGLSRFVNESRAFVYRPKMVLDVTEIRADSNQVNVVCEKNYVSIEAVPITSTLGTSWEPVQSDIEPDPKRSRGALVICYVCKIKDIPGKFDPQKASALGIPRGPLFGKLTKGEEVTLPDGRVIAPGQVILPPTPGPIVMIVCCPDVSYIASLISESGLSSKYLNPSMERNLCIIHFSTLSVLSDQRYSSWMASFGGNATHIALDETICPMRPVFRGHADAMYKANLTLGETYAPLPKGYIPGEEGDPVLGFLDAIVPGKVVRGDTLLRYRIAPAASIGVDASQVPPKSIVLDSIKAQVDSNDRLQSELRRTLAVDQLETLPNCLREISDKAAELRFLGTAAAIPGKHRNVSAILLNLFHRGCALLDCGEGTYGQMVRALGRTEALEKVVSLLFVWISHMHADHHLGLLHILSKRISLKAERPLVVIGPSKLRAWLASYSEIIGGDNRMIFIDSAELIEPQQPLASYFPENFGVQLRCCEVVHCPQAYGIVVGDCVNHWKLCYSGDTRPCEELVKIGRNSTIAIHEATLEDGMEQEAEEKAHCTISEALDICDKMNAHRTILTHFSQRYPRIPLIKSSEDRLKRVAVAFDFLRVNFKDLAQLPRTLPLLQALYPNEAPVAKAGM